MSRTRSPDDEEPEDDAPGTEGEDGEESGAAGEFEDRLREVFADPGYRPMSKSELARHLELQPGQRAALRAAIRRLESSGEIIRGRKARYQPRRQSRNLVTGTIRFRLDGSAFLTPDSSDPQNAPVLAKLGSTARVFIPSRHTLTALNGDRVAAQVEEAGVPKWWKHVKAKRELIDEIERTGGTRLEGRVVRILARGRARLIGTYRVEGRFAYVQPDDPTLPPAVRIAPGPDRDAKPAKPGEKVVATIERWDARDVPPEGTIAEVLGPADAPGVDILSIIHQYHLPLEFPPEVVAEADQVPARIPESEIAGREDWRDRFVITIDPFDARDFDDAISVTALPEGGWELAVHIADVSHYVRPGSALDTEARERGNSVYLVDRVLPMLPPELSNGICSLRPGEDRLTRVVVMRFRANGSPDHGATRFAGAVINSQARLDYHQAYALMKDPTPGDPVSDHLATAWDLASRLRRRRFAGGALDLDFAEIKVHLDDAGRPVRLERVEYDESHQLIEEFMLAANEAVARFVQRKERPCIYRIHEDPDEGKLFEFRELVRAYGIRAGDLSQRGEIQKLLEVIRGRPEEHALKIALLKSLKRAAYSATPIGHFGLAKDHYTHYTSPIRRYADLVVHRVLNHLLEPSAPGFETPTQARMEEIAEHISDTERIAANAEYESRKLKELEFLAELARRPDQSPMRALIYEIRPLGLFVELEEFLIKGLVKRDDLPGGGGFRYDHALQRFIPAQGKNALKVGDELDVVVARVDFDRRLIDFRPAVQDGGRPGGRTPRGGREMAN